MTSFPGKPPQINTRPNPYNPYGGGFPGSSPVANTVPTSATGPGGPHGHLAPMPAGGPMNPTQVRAMQQFLNNHGFQVAQDGILGPLTKSAAAAFRANHKGGEAWNKAHGIGVHPAARDTAPGGRGPAGGGTGGGGGGTPPAPMASGYSADFNSLLSALLAGGGQVGSMADPRSFGDAAAAPDVATALALSRQIGANPKQEAQNQADISSWYGLDPTASSYKLSVLGRLAQARKLDAGAATAASSNIGDLAKSLAGSIGGAANDGSASVLGAGTDAAGTMAALGEAQKQYADQMDPLLRAEAVGAASREKAANSQTMLDLQDKLAAARGQGASDRAQAVLAVLDKNNALSQQRFANEGNLLSTLAQLQSIDPNTAGLKDAQLKAEIAKLQAEAGYSKAKATAIATGTMGVNGGLGGKTLTPDRIDPTSAAISVTKGLGLATDQNTGAPIVPQGMENSVATHIGAYLRGLKLSPSNPNFKKIGDAILSMFVDQNGQPLQAHPDWVI